MENVDSWFPYFQYGLYLDNCYSPFFLHSIKPFRISFRLRAMRLVSHIETNKINAESKSNMDYSCITDTVWVWRELYKCMMQPQQHCIHLIQCGTFSLKRTKNTLFIVIRFENRNYYLKEDDEENTTFFSLFKFTFSVKKNADVHNNVQKCN